MAGANAWRLLGLLAVAAAAEPATAGAAADSVADFSGIQGQAGWQYGFYDVGADADGVYQPEDFQQFSPSAWTGALWDLQGSSTPATMITQVGGKPSGTENPVATQWAVRRWVSNASGRFVISGEHGALDARGNGTRARIIVDGHEVFTRVDAGSPRPYSVEVWLGEGSTLDLALDSNGDGLFDLARFTARITPAPCPADVDHNGRVDVFDLLTMLTDWFASDADFNTDGVTDRLDLLDFIHLWIGSANSGPCP